MVTWLWLYNKHAGYAGLVGSFVLQMLITDLDSEMQIQNRSTHSRSGLSSTTAEVSISVTDKAISFLGVVRGFSFQKPLPAVNLNTEIRQQTSTRLCSPQLRVPRDKWPESTVLQEPSFRPVMISTQRFLSFKCNRSIIICAYFVHVSKQNGSILYPLCTSCTTIYITKKVQSSGKSVSSPSY